MISAGFKTFVEDRYFEDYVTGSVHEFGMIAIQEKGIIAFGNQLDPQIFHTDHEGAKDSNLYRRTLVRYNSSKLKSFKEVKSYA